MEDLYKAVSNIIKDTKILIPIPCGKDEFTGKICELDSDIIALEILLYLNRNGNLVIEDGK